MQPQLTEPQKAERRQRLEQLHREFFDELQETSWGFYGELRGQISQSHIKLGIEKKGDDYIDCFAMSFASEITFSIEDDTFGHRDAEINFGSSGSFTPEHAAQYWRTKHACIILDHWQQFHEIAKRYCGRYTVEFLNQ